MKTINITPASVIYYITRHHYHVCFNDEEPIVDDGERTQDAINDIRENGISVIDNEVVAKVISRKLGICSLDRDKYVIAEAGTTEMAINIEDYKEIGDIPSPDDIYLFHIGSEDGERVFELEGRVPESGCPSVIDPDAEVPEVTEEDIIDGFDLVYARRVKDMSYSEFEAAGDDPALTASLLINGIATYDDL